MPKHRKYSTDFRKAEREKQREARLLKRPPLPPPMVHVEPPAVPTNHTCDTRVVDDAKSNIPVTGQ